jgi:PGF-CTERM protein
LYAPNRTELTNSSAFEGVSTASISTTAPETGTYYIYLGSDYSGQNIPYRLYTPASAAPESPTPGETQTQIQTAEGTTTPPSTTTDTSTQSNATGNTSIDYPAGYSASGIEDPTQAANQYSSALSKYSSYSAQRNFTSIFQDEVNHINNTFRVDVANERAYTYENLSGDGNPIVEETYRISDVTYTRTLSSLSDGPQYEAQSQPFTVTYNTTAPALEQYLQSATYGPAETINRNGETLIRYEATEIVEPGAFLVTANDTSAVSSFNATLVVDQNGILRNYSYSVEFEGEDGNQIQKQSTLALTGLNETSVSEPGWIDEARANLGGQSESTSVAGGTATAGTPTATTTAGEPSTQTMEVTSTPTESTNGSISTTNTGSGNESSGSSTFGPGFGPVVALGAILAAGLLAVRYR